MAEPEFRVLDDAVHFEWAHDCRHQATGRGFRDVTTMPHGGGTWRIEQVEPLTVRPSMHCLACGTHGFITDGKWVAV